MKLKNNKSGFTLLEIIIVIIIVGVLASLALPRFFSTVEYSRATEALNSLGVIRQAVVRCGLLDNSITLCGTFADLDISDPGLEPGSHFTYAIAVDTPATDDMTLTATRNITEGGNLGDTIVLVVAAGGITRTGSGAFASIK